MYECRKKIYNSNIVAMRGTLMCRGGFGQLVCEHFEECLKEVKYAMKKFKEEKKETVHL